MLKRGIMLKDSISKMSKPVPGDLNISNNWEVEKIIEFIDTNLLTFPPYYLTIRDSNRENRISDMLVHHFQICKMEHNGGYFPFDFRKNPTQAISGQETDIGIFVLTRDAKPLPIVEFEAKRFSSTSNNQQYVYGAGRGGIERFKREEHSPHLSIAGMFAYVQNGDCDTWITKVNDWIKNLGSSNSDSSIDWSAIHEQLVRVNSDKKIVKLSSLHNRKGSNNEILLWHYFIDLN
jgi:hypothetical protein